MTKQVHFGAILHGIGGTTDGWRHPQVDETASTNLNFYKTRAQLAEKGLFDFVFIADGLYISEKSIPHFLNRFEPITLLSSLAAVTENIGLVGTFSTTYTDPFTISRQLLSLDHLSNGRAGWNLVTTPQAGVAENFNNRTLPPHGERYKIAQEHLDVVRGLWRSWEPDAFPRNKETGQYFDPEKLHRLNYEGEYFQVAGPLNIGRSPQGEPLVFQAGSSDSGRAFAAGNAEAILTHANSLEEVKAFYDDIKARAKAAGRNPEEVKVYPGINPLVGDTLEDAEAAYTEFASLIPIENAVKYLARYFDDYDFSGYDLDAPFPDLGDIGKDAFRSTTDYIKKRAKEENQTLRQVALEQAVTRPNFIGTAEDIADEIQRWVEADAVDGFIIAGDIPGAFERFVNEVVPILQDRGIYRTEYPGTTLREQIGVPIVP